MSDHDVATLIWVCMIAAFVVLAGLALRRDKDLLSPGVCLTILLGLYSLVLPGRFVLFGSSPFEDWTYPTFYAYNALCFLALVGMTVGYHASARPHTDDESPRRRSMRPDRLRWAAAVCAAFGLVLVFILFATVGGLSQYLSIGYGGGVYLLLQDKGELQFGFHLLNAAVIILAFVDFYCSGRKVPLTSLAIAVPLVAFYLVMGDRGSILRLVIGYLVLYHMTVKRFHALTFVPAVAALAVVFVIFGHARGQEGLIPKFTFAVSNFSWDWLNVFLYVGEFQAPGVALKSLLEAPSLELRLGLTYIDSIFYLIPSGIWPGRPLPLLTEYTATYRPALLSSGNGLGMLSVAEAYWNFGFAGPLVVFAAFGLLWRRLYQFVRRSGGVGTLLYAMMLPTAILLMRVDFADYLKVSVYYLLPTLLSVWFASRSDNMTIPFGQAQLVD